MLKLIKRILKQVEEQLDFRELILNSPFFLLGHGGDKGSHLNF